MKSLVGETFGKYQIRRLLGKGGMGEVYEAYDTDKGRTVALKVLPQGYADDEKFRARFLRESRAAAILQEPHVIPIHDWGEIDNVLYIDMRLVQGQTLEDMLKARTLEPQRAIDIVRQIAAALDAAHAEGLIHRDVKPQNIIVTRDDFAYLVDFGIAETRGDTRLTKAGHQIGSWAYMAPERFGEQPATPAVDIYSLACVLYEALTGRLPFEGQSQQVIAGHLSSPPPKPSAVNPEVPVAVDDVIARGMAKHPDDRYGSAGALARAAKRALADDAPSSGALPAAVTPPPNRAAPSNYPPFTAPPSYPAYTAPPSYPPFNAQPSYPPFTGPPSYPATGPGYVTSPPEQQERSRFLLPTVIAVSVVLVVVVVVVVLIGVLASGNSGTDNASPTTEYTTPDVSSYPTASSSATSSTVTSTRQDPEQQLRQLANSDRSFVAAELADRWIPQLSAKRPGVVDNGVTWDNAMALQEHQQLRQRFPSARLLWSGDWTTFSAPNFWVTVVGITFPDSKGALAWCRSQGFDRDHCIAKIVSTTHPVEGSTDYNS